MRTWRIQTMANIEQTYEIKAQTRQEAERIFHEEKERLEFIETGECFSEELMLIEEITRQCKRCKGVITQETKVYCAPCMLRNQTRKLK